MAKQRVTLLDIHNRNNSVGPLLEENTAYSPEFGLLPTKRINGTTFKQRVRSSLHDGGGFNKPGAGAVPGASTYDFKEFQCKHLEYQLEIAEAIAKAEAKQAAGSDGNFDAAISDVLVDEASGTIRKMMLDMGEAFYYGKAKSDGFVGLHGLVDNAMVVNAGGSGGTEESVFFIYEGENDGVAWILPNGEELDLRPWTEQQIVVNPTKGTKTMAYISALAGYLGLKAAQPEKVIGRVKNCTTGAAAITDARAAEIISRFPIGMKPTRCFMSRTQAFQLQVSRSSNVTDRNDTQGSNFVPTPTEIQGVPIVITDSLKTAAVQSVEAA